jgi:hypothetical protein
MIVKPCVYTQPRRFERPGPSSPAMLLGEPISKCNNSISQVIIALILGERLGIPQMSIVIVDYLKNYYEETNDDL